MAVERYRMQTASSTEACDGVDRQATLLFPAIGMETSMIKWAIIFFIISLVAGVLGFTDIAAGARGIAKILFFIALVIFLIVLIFGVFLGKALF